MKKTAYMLPFLAICTAFVISASGCSSNADWVRKTIEQHYYRFDGDYSSLGDLRGLTVEEMIDRLDIYSEYYTAEEYGEVTADNAGSKSGIGVSYSFEAGKGIVIRSVVGNSPAKKSGLKAGDVVLSAETQGGEKTEFNGIDGFSAFAGERADGEEFYLNLADGNRVAVAKSDYTASYACMYTRDFTYNVEYNDGKRTTVKSEGGSAALPENTAYIYLSQFYGGAYGETGDLISEFNAAGCDALILDLRGDGGGFVKIMAEIGGLFTAPLGGEKHVAMTAKYKDGGEEVTYCEEYGRGTAEYQNRTVKKETKVYVMANDGTASASEALIGILVSYDILKYENIFLSDYGDSEPRSYGKGIMQTVYRKYYSHGPALKLTVAGIYWQNGKTIHGMGLTAGDGCGIAPASDRIVNVGYDDELLAVAAKINADRAAAAPLGSA